MSIFSEVLRGALQGIEANLVKNGRKKKKSAVSERSMFNVWLIAFNVWESHLESCPSCLVVRFVKSTRAFNGTSIRQMYISACVGPCGAVRLVPREVSHPQKICNFIFKRHRFVLPFCTISF